MAQVIDNVHSYPPLPPAADSVALSSHQEHRLAVAYESARESSTHTLAPEEAHLDLPPGNSLLEWRNSQPLDIYLHYAAIERQREAADPRPVPDAPWVILWKKMRGRRDQIVWPPAASRAAKRNARATVAETMPRAHPIPDERLSAETDPTSSGSSPINTLSKRSGPAMLSTSTINHKLLDSPTKEKIPISPTGPAVPQSAYRLVRVASWQVVFYLIITDVFGFQTAPKAIQALGFVPGAVLFTIFFVLAFVGGQALWYLYMRLDSEQYPVVCYADMAERLFGRWARHILNILQSFQLIFNVAMLLVACSQTISALTSNSLCFLAIMAIWGTVGAAVSQVRSLRQFAWFSIVNLWFNLFGMIVTMVAIGLFPPDPAQSGHKDLSEPVRTHVLIPSTSPGLYEQATGVQLIAFSYGGAMLFIEFLAEMRRPTDFWKAALIAQTFIWIAYTVFGLFVYSKQGQYTAIIPSINFQNLPLMGVANILQLVGITVISILYANIGIKVFYQNILREYFRAPPLLSKKGRYIWSASISGYWLLAFVLGCAIPDIQYLVTFIGSLSNIQFTYTFPPAMLCAFLVLRDAAKGDNHWEPGMQPRSNRVDNWNDLSRWRRGFQRLWWAKGYLILHTIAALALCVLGTYSGIRGAMESFKTGFTRAFSCDAPGA